MYFCRHQLLRPPAQRQFSSLLATRHVTYPALLAHIYTASYRHARFSSSRVNPTAPSDSPTAEPAGGQPATPPDRAAGSFKFVSRRVDVDSPEETNIPFPKEEEDSELPSRARTQEPEHPLRHEWLQIEMSPEFAKDPCTEYMQWRSKHTRAAVLHISRGALRTVIIDALTRKQRRVMDALVDDGEYMAKTKAIDDNSSLVRSYLAINLLKHVAPHRFLSKRQILILLRVLRDRKSLWAISAVNTARIANAVLSYEPNGALDGPLFDVLQHMLIKKLPTKATRPTTISSESWEPTSSGGYAPLVVWPLFRLMLAYARRDDRARASETMAILLQGRRIDQRAINSTDLNPQDYVYVTLSVIVRACIHNGWFSRATTLLCPTVAARDKVSHPLARLIEDWLVAALTAPRDQDLAEAASMIMILMDRAEGYIVPNEILERFYSEAAKADKGELMQAVYRHSRDIQHYSYQPPRGDSLAWFARYLRAIRRDVHLARVLAKHIVEEDIPVEPAARGSLIFNCAAFGFTLQARALWERWSIGPDRSYVVAMSATMLRLVSAFVNSEAATRRAAMRRPASPPVPPRINPSGQAAGKAGDQEEDKQATEQETQSNDQVEGDHPASDAPHSPSSPAPDRREAEKAGENAVLAPSSDGSVRPALVSDVSVLGGFAVLTREELLERADDIRGFAEQVFDAFMEARTPLEDADRFTVNAAARGAFILGRDSVAFGMFELLKKRGIQLGLHDLNVVISVVAKTNPAVALQRIQKMIDVGIQPDAVTYGTVIHWAIYHGDAPLVGRIVEMARERGLENFSFKTLAALVRATVQPEFLAGAPQSSPVENVEDIVGTMLEMGILPSPNVGRDCVRAALIAEDPVRAFRFWKELLKEKVQWDDPGWTRMRRDIAQQIREHYNAGWLDELRARVMLSELGFDLYSLYDLRRVAAQRFDGSD